MRALPLLLLLVAACSSGSSGPPPGGPLPAPDFLLLDVNDTSTTYNQAVSPRDFLQMTSGHYFGAAT